MASHGKVFSDEFLHVLRSLVAVHHSIYPTIPPQGIFFESLVEEAFKRVRIPFSRVEITKRNVPKHDIVVGDVRISLKTETGLGTKRTKINITKLCTTERDPWEAEALINHAVDHLSRYDQILMLRAVWSRPIISYQIVEIPIEILRLLNDAELKEVGKRPSRRSLGTDVYDKQGEIMFHIHFDGSDGKCQIRNLKLDSCRMLHEWQQQIDE